MKNVHLLKIVFKTPTVLLYFGFTKTTLVG